MHRNHRNCSPVERYCIKLGLSLIFVWYEAWFIFSTRLNDCYSFHLRELRKFSWQLSRQTTTPSNSKARKMHEETILKFVFKFIFEVIVCT